MAPEIIAFLFAVGVFGGTFNPVHYGHLRSALELVEKLGLEELRLMPCAVPPHREQPGCSARPRAAMRAPFCSHSASSERGWR